MRDRPRPRNQQRIRCVNQQPRQPDLGRCRAEFAGDVEHHGVIGDLGETRERRPQREVRHPGDSFPALSLADLEHLLLRAVEQAVGVLHTHNPGGQRAPQHIERHAADADPTDLAFVAQRDHFGELVVHVDDLVTLGRQAGSEVEAAQVDHRNALDAELAQVVFHGGAQLGGPLRRGQRYRFFAGVSRTDLADDGEVVRVGRQRRADAAVHLAGAVKRRGVDVVDAEFDSAAQHRGSVVSRCLEQLHGAIADPGDGVGGDAAGAAGVWLVCHWCSLDRETLEKCGGPSACLMVAETEDPPLWLGAFGPTRAGTGKSCSRWRPRPSPRRLGGRCRWSRSPVMPASGSARSIAISPAGRRWSRRFTGPSSPKWPRPPSSCYSGIRPRLRCAAGWTATRTSWPPSAGWPSRYTRCSTPAPCNPARLATASPVPWTCCYRRAPATAACAPTCKPTMWCPASSAFS